ncbi:hypothetical protein D3C79_459290 [compost metagenome]
MIGNSTVNSVAPNEGKSCSLRTCTEENSAGTGLNGRRLPTSLRNSGPPISEAASPTIKPYTITEPTSAPSLLVTNNAAGCGGTTQCTAINAVHSGIANFSKEVLVFLAIENASGISNTTPTSTNSVMPQTNPTSTIITSADSQRHFCKVMPIRSAAPDTSIMLPKMVPKPITAARKPKVPPMPPSMALTISSGFMPIRAPT